MLVDAEKEVHHLSRAGLSEAIQRLVESGEVRIIRKAYGHRSTTYLIVLLAPPEVLSAHPSEVNLVNPSEVNHAAGG